MIFGLTGLMTVSCGKDDGPGEPPAPPTPERPDTPDEPDTPDTPEDPDTPENQPAITVETPSGTDGTVKFNSDADRMDISLTANFSAPYTLMLSGDYGWLFVDKNAGNISEEGKTTVTLYANRRGMDVGTHRCNLIVETEDVKKEVPVEIDITEFVPFGSYKKITSCDSRLVVTFAGCYKRDGYMNLEYTITNNGDDIRGLKLWSHPNYTYFNAAGRRYDKDSGLTSVLGSQSGTGDISTPVRSGETIRCSHRFPIGENLPADGIDAHLMIYNYGTGDWNCAGKYIDFLGLECENLDNFNPDYRPTPPPAPEPDPQITVDVASLDFSTDMNKMALSFQADRNVNFRVSTSEKWLMASRYEGDAVAGQPVKVYFTVNRFNLEPGKYDATINISTSFQSIDIPVSMTIAEFKPYGACSDISSCDYRLPVTFYGCYKSGNDVTLMYKVRNTSDESISGFKLWQNPNFTYFIDNLGNRYTKDSGTFAVLGSQSGTGDISTRLAPNETILCSFTIKNVHRNASSFTTVVARLYNYGTGDFQCQGKEIVFSNVLWTDLDILF